MWNDSAFLPLLPSGAGSVMASRHEPPDSLDDFPTPPWATRALMERVLLPVAHPVGPIVWEPACGRGLMSAVLAEYFWGVVATDIHDYCSGERHRWPEGWCGRHDFLAENTTPDVDWVITNPPFRLSVDFALRALEVAQEGVALLVRTSWLEGGDRYERLFEPHPPTLMAQFSERVPMVKGRWDPSASTATSYAWFVWLLKRKARAPALTWIPPGQQKALTHLSDMRFVRVSDAPLFDEVAA